MSALSLTAILSVFLLTLEIPANETEFIRLQQVLEQYGFKVQIEASPVRGAYGLFDYHSQTIWIDPIVFDLGIAKPTLIHEAVHAVQSCHGNGEPKALALQIPPPAITRRYFLRYDSFERQLEAEAYTIQVQPDGVDLAIELLHQHCSKTSTR